MRIDRGVAGRRTYPSDMREIDRYPKATLRDRLEELVDSVRAHPFRTAALVIGVVIVGLSLLNAPRTARLDTLAVGECLYARTSASTAVGAGGRPIGDPSEVEAVIDSGGAEYAGCGASHGHEVSAIVELAPFGPASIGRAELRAAVQARCDAAFEGYVGRPADGSEFETFAVLPSDAQIADGATVAACLIARRDGQWLAGQARDSGR
jgi:hypothetical protein